MPLDAPGLRVMSESEVKINRGSNPNTNGRPNTLFACLSHYSRRLYFYKSPFQLPIAYGREQSGRGSSWSSLLFILDNEVRMHMAQSPR